MFITVRSREGTAVLTTGAILRSIMAELKQFDTDWVVFSVPFIGVYLSENLVELAGRFDTFITVEEHQLNGGFSSSFIEAFSDLYAKGILNRMPRIQRIGIPS